MKQKNGSHVAAHLNAEIILVVQLGFEGRVMNAVQGMKPYMCVTWLDRAGL